MAFPAAAQLFNIATLKPPETVFDNSFKPWDFTALVPAIAYDNGGSAVAYNSLSQNQSCTANGSSYRADYIVGNFKPSTLSPPNPAIPYQICTVVGDWYQYTISSNGTGPFNLTLYTTNPNGGANWAVSIDGTQVATVVAQGNGSDFNTVLPATSGQFAMTTGNHLLRLTALSGDPIGGWPGDFVQWQGGFAGPSVPAQAAAAGFTAQILKADFTQTTGPWSNAANFMTNCGAANSVPGQPSTWHFTYNIWPTGPSLPCDHASIAVDPDFGNRALLLRMTPADYATNNNSNQGDDLMFPDYVGHNTGQNTWVPMEQYVKIVWREPASSYNMGGTCGPISCYGSGVSAPWSAPLSFSSENLDWSEIGGYTSLSTLYFFQTIGNYSGGEVDSPPGQDVTKYKTIEGLSTSDGSTVLAMCLWVDGNWAGCIRGFSKSYTVRDYITLVALNINRGPNDPQSMPNELDVYIKSLEWWSCPNYLTANCVGAGFPVVDHWPFP